MLLSIFTNKISRLTFRASWEMIPHTERAKRAHPVFLGHFLHCCSKTLLRPPWGSLICTRKPQMSTAWLSANTEAEIKIQLAQCINRVSVLKSVLGAWVLVAKVEAHLLMQRTGEYQGHTIQKGDSPFWIPGAQATLLTVLKAYKEHMAPETTR